MLIRFLLLTFLVHADAIGSYFKLYTDAWVNQHQSWIGEKSNAQTCTSGITFPTCVGGRSLDYPHEECPQLTCVDDSDDCMATPQDTTDYIPPSINIDATTSICTTARSNATVFSTGFGLDEGIPPHFMPLQTIPFHIQGRVLGKMNGKCIPLSTYKMDAWQIDPKSYSDALTDLSTGTDTTAASTSTTSLRDKSCRGRTDSNAVIGQDGSYWFNTTMPASYGPPRHINFMITADGYETLITRMYIDRDYRLHQLTVLNGHDETEASTLIDQFYQSPGYNRGFATDDDATLGTEHSKEAMFPGAVGRDPRVAKVTFNHRGVTDIPESSVYVSGYFSTEFNFVLKPLRYLKKPGHHHNLANKEDAAVAEASAVNTVILPLNITGLWADLSVDLGDGSSGGGLIKIDSFGSRFVAMEYPHPRSWGVVTGHLMGDVITGVDFRTSHVISSLLNVNPDNANRPASVVDMTEFLSDYDVQSVKNYRNSMEITTPVYQNGTGQRKLNTGSGAINIIASTDGLGTVERSSMDNNIEQKNLYKSNIITPGFMTNGLSTGLIVSKDATTDSPMAATIHWHGPNGYSGFWSRKEDLRGYRYLKLRVLRETGGYAGGKMNINEIRFYTGVISQNEVLFPDRKMKSPRTPFPQVVSCSSFQDQDHHCWKAFDGDDTSSSAWVTKPVGSRDHVLTDPQWVIIDLGRGRSAFPTSVRITCDVGSTGDGTGSSSSNVQGSGSDTIPSGCPMTFTVSGSYDNIKYDTVFAKDLNEYNNEYGAAQSSQLALRAAREAYNSNISSAGASISSTAGDTVAQTAANDITVLNILHQPSVSVGLMFDFFWETPLGYPLGHRCGSCYTPPLFACSLNANDATCASGYCTDSGLCGNIPECPAGQFQESLFSAYDKPVYTCKQCPGGSYGAVPGLTDPSCSGLCAPGYYCPPGSTSPNEKPCGNPTVFCPEGSARPTKSSAGWKTITGIYPVNNTVQVDAMSPLVSPTTFLDPTSTSSIVSKLIVQNAMYNNLKTEGMIRSAELLCTPGHYCIGGEEIPCPTGTYGNSTGLQTRECSGKCIAGEHCAEGSVVPARCPKGSYCPDGMIKFPCPAGVYGGMTGIKSPRCTGPCRVGHYCPQGSESSTAVKCPAGRYGAHAGLQDSLCSGLCSAGYYCPLGSTSATAVACGGLDSYCPMGSAAPVPVDLGYYTAEGHDPNTMSTQIICEAGFYCERGVKYQCPAGTYGALEGMYEAMMHVGAAPVVEVPNSDILLSEVTAPTTSAPTSTPSVSAPLPNSETDDTLYHPSAICSGSCARGSYCPINSTSATQVPCPAGRYGDRPGLQNELCTAVCPVGHYCPLGSVTPIPCRAGIFGNTTGLTSAHCNPRCYDNRNLMSDVRANVNALAQQAVSQQQQLLSSQFGNDNCRDNLCEAGYYCPIGSVSGKQIECGSPDVFCPIGSSLPTPVRSGYYSLTMPESVSRINTLTGVSGSSSIDTLTLMDGVGKEDLSLGHVRTTEALCDKGYYCDKGVRHPCPAGTYGETEGLLTPACSGVCPMGYYCTEGTINKFEHRCLAGRYGDSTGLTNSGCSGVCAAGYYCPEQSTSPTQVQCGYSYVRVEPSDEQVNTVIPGARLGKPNSVFCLEGSSVPLVAHPGYSTVLGNLTTRENEVPCPHGAYCSEGVVYDCPAGRYGITERLQTPECSGLCQKGFYCPPGSKSRNEIPCPRGRYGDREGLTNFLCSGACQNPYYCPEGSTEPTVKNTEKAGNIW